MHGDLHVEHHNRGVVLQGAEAILAIMREFALVVSDRQFHSVRRQFVANVHVVMELTWEAIPIVDIPGFATRGETLAWSWHVSGASATVESTIIMITGSPTLARWVAS